MLTLKVAQNVTDYPLHHVSYAPVKFEVAMCEGFGGDAFTIEDIITPCVLYAPAKFEVAMCEGFGGDAFKIKYII